MLQWFWKLGQNAITTFPCFGVGKENKRRKNGKKRWHWQWASAVLPTPLTCATAPSAPTAALVSQNRHQESPKAGSPGKTLAISALTAVLEVWSKWKMQLGTGKNPEPGSNPCRWPEVSGLWFLGKAVAPRSTLRSSPLGCHSCLFPYCGTSNISQYFGSPAPLQTFSTGEGKYCV